VLFAEQARQDAHAGRGARIGWSLFAFAIIGALGLSFIPSPYVLERPGPVFDTLGEVTVGDDDVPLISIPGEKTYPTAGSLDMLTVNVVGNRDERPSWLEVVGAWADPSEAVVPLDAVYPEGESIEQSNEQSAVDMQNSQKDAIAASLGELGYELDATLSIAGFSPESPAEGALEADDVIVSVNGESPADVADLRAIIAENGTSSAATVVVRRGDSEVTQEVTPVLAEGDGSAPILGIAVAAEYDFPFEVKIQLENVGGPSAGMMFALGIIDKLTPGELNGGSQVAGTGTITADGVVGPIGGIRQKLYGARDAGAAYFLAPEANCDQVVGHVPDGLRVFSVETLDDAMAALDAISRGAGQDDLPTCTG
jgi:PDZ domain-containing protein